MSIVSMSIDNIDVLRRAGVEFKCLDYKDGQFIVKIALNGLEQLQVYLVKLQSSVIEDHIPDPPTCPLD